MSEQQFRQCPCASLEEIVRLKDVPALESCIEVVEFTAWVRLFKCLNCGQFWLVDDWDKLQVQFAIKIAKRDDWQKIDSTTLRKEFLMRSRGGLTSEPCKWLNCGGMRVRGSVYCVEHLFQTGARE